MKLILSIDVELGGLPWFRIDEVARTIAEDVALMMNEKHGDIYRTTTLFQEVSEG